MSIKPKVGKCTGKDGKYIYCGKENVPLVSNRQHCHYCSQRWKNENKKDKNRSSKTIKQNSRSKKLRKPTGELAMFLEIWKDMPLPRKCDHCGRPQFVFRVDSFAHIKPKGTHPELRLEKSNIWFSCSYFDDKHGFYGCHVSQTFESKEKFNARKDSFKG